MSPTERAGLDPGFVIASRYRVDGALEGEFSVGAYTGTDTEAQTPVVILEVGPALHGALNRAQRVEHAHLARILSVTEEDGRLLAVFERVAGETLEERLAKIGKKVPVDAVRSALRVADALSALHEAGTAHGLVHPRNVVLEAEGREGPILVYGPLTAAETAFRQPEWEPIDPPSEPDDTWGVAALFHLMLVGEPPPREGYTEHTTMVDLGVTDAALRAALFHALAKDVGRRGHDLRPLKRELARWFVEHAGEEVVPVPHHSTSPPPLPQELLQRSLPPTPSRRFDRASVPVREPSKVPILAIAGILLGLIGGWVVSSLRASHQPKPPPVAARIVPAQASSKSIELSDIPVTGQSETVSTDKMGSCVAGYLPKGTFVKVPDMGWVCEESDPLVGAEKLRVAIVNGAKGTTTQTMQLFYKLGWYDMAAFAVVRSGCCTGAKPLALSSTSKDCAPMGEALHDVGSAVVAQRNVEEPLKKYKSAVMCEIEAGHSAPLRHASRPNETEEAAFTSLIHAIQQ